MNQSTERFQILSLSGGGFRGLYSAQIIARIEQEIDAPIASRFDLIAGTSIGGILALALAQEIRAQKIIDLFVNHGNAIFKKQYSSLFGILKAKYSSAKLKELLSEETLFGERLLGACKHPVIIPSINYSSGKPVIFKTPHNANLKQDHLLKMVDIALATSAAPSFFPRHVFNNNQYVDGGLYANAPGLLAAHEAEYFFNQHPDSVRILSIGTMSSKFTVDPRKNRKGGTIDWGGINPANTPPRLFGLTISTQESLCDFMLKHRFQDRYLHVDDDLTADRANAVSLDKTNNHAQEVLLGAGMERAKYCIGDARFMEFLKHTPKASKFFYGENSNSSGANSPC